MFPLLSNVKCCVVAEFSFDRWPFCNFSGFLMLPRCISSSRELIRNYLVSGALTRWMSTCNGRAWRNGVNVMRHWLVVLIVVTKLDYAAPLPVVTSSITSLSKLSFVSVNWTEDFLSSLAHNKSRCLRFRHIWNIFPRRAVDFYTKFYPQISNYALVPW